MEVKIEKLDNFGRGIAYLDNKICFVEKALPGEVVEITITKEKRKFQEATCKNYIQKSKNRIEEECPYSKICGGCQLNHMTYEEELRFKEEKVKNVLKKYAGIEEEKIKPILYHERDHYRNKITLHGKDKILGLYQEKTNDIIPIKSCLIASNHINEVLKKLQEENKNLKTCKIFATNNDNKVMIQYSGEKNEKIKHLASIVYQEDKKETEEKDFINEIGNYKYHVGYNSFFQINNTLTESLYDEVANIVKEKQPKNVLDLYCGGGTIGIYISSYCEKIIGVDNNPSNIEDEIPKTKTGPATVNILAPTPIT